MDRIRNLKDYRIYLALVITMAVTMALFPNEGRFKYKYQKGRPWIYETLLAPIDFPILKTDAELLQEKEDKASTMVPYYDYNSVVSFKQLKLLGDLQSKEELNKHFITNIIESFTKIYSVGLSAPMDDNSMTDRVIVVKRDKKAIETASSEVFDVNTASAFIKKNILKEYPGVNSDSLFSALHVSDYLIPNLLYNQKMSELIHKDAVDYISPTKGMIYTGQLIVNSGDIVTAEIAQLLDSFKAEYEISYGYSGSLYGLVSGHGIILFFILAALFAVIYFTDSKVFSDRNMFYFILVLFILLVLVTVIIRNINPTYLYMVPYAVFALYLLSFFKQSFAFPVYAVLLLPLLLIAGNGIELYFINLVAGTVALVSFFYLNKGWFQFLNAFAILICVVVAYSGFKLSADGSFSSFDPHIVLYLSANALFVVGAYPLSFLFEKIFSLVSNSRLLDLSDTNNRLLRELSQKAPGTFQHSLQVSNLAGAAAREIGANIILARVGALYHDIGKIQNPQCFVENQAAGINYHKRLSPIESAQQIIRHVDDGVDIAKKNKLPGVVIDFIKTHHAQTLTGYFYAVYCNSGGNPDNKDPFTYHGDLPRTKEQVIVLMADAVEAASRSLRDYSSESISNLVDSIMASRLSDSQLINADISIREITMVKELFKKHISQVYHERIAYPTVK